MMMNRSKYMSANQCMKKAWLETHRPELVSPVDDSVYSEFNELKEYAFQCYPGIIEAKSELSGANGMLTATKKLINDGITCIANAMFEKDQISATADVLIVNDDGSVDAVMVKSSTQGTKKNPHYIEEARYIAFAIENAGYRINAFTIKYIDNSYIKDGEVIPSSLFHDEDITEEAKSHMDEIEDNIRVYQQAYASETEPKCELDNYCKKPHECQYRAYCMRYIPKYSVFNIPGYWHSKALEMYYSDIITYEDLVNTGAIDRLNEKQRRYVLAKHEGRGEEVDADAFAEFVKENSDIYGHFDFESVSEMVPRYDGTHPYQQVATQYSLHYYDEGGELQHREFLAVPEKGDPMRQVAEAMVADIPYGAKLSVWNASFEKGRLKEMSQIFPDLADHLMSLHDNIVDLMPLFRDGAYHNPETNGSYSIKVVSAVLFKGDPELDYHALNHVHNGAEAANAYLLLEKLEARERAELTLALLDYCRVDTLALVKIWDKMREFAKM